MHRPLSFLDAILHPWASASCSFCSLRSPCWLTLPRTGARDPDGTVLIWLDHEEALFRVLERHLVGTWLGEGKIDVDSFLKFSLQVHQRRKSRAGYAAENHLEAIFRAHKLPFERGVKTEGKRKPDFLMPGKSAYLDPTFPESRLAMLGVKTTCKDRWRQVLTEANRIKCKHLFTIETGISEDQTSEMRERSVQLVVPAAIQDTFTGDQRQWLWNLRDFIAYAGELGRLANKFRAGSQLTCSMDRHRQHLIVWQRFYECESWSRSTVFQFSLQVTPFSAPRTTLPPCLPAATLAFFSPHSWCFLPPPSASVDTATPMWSAEHMSNQTILITGATGQQGGATARALAGKGFKIRALTRKPDGDAAKALAAAGADIVTGDLNDESSLKAALAGAWGAYAVQNTWEAGVEGEETQGKRFATLAKAAGVEHFVYASVGSAHRNTGIPHFENKSRVEDTIRGLGFPSHAIVRPVFFMENMVSAWFLNGDKIYSALQPSTPLQMIAVNDIGQYGALAFTDAARFRNRAIDIAGDSVTMSEAAATLSGALGRQIEYVQIPMSEVRKNSEDFALMLEWFEAVGYNADIAGNAKEFGIAPTSFASWAATQKK